MLKVQDFDVSGAIPSSSESKSTLVFLHGWGVNSGVFESLLPELQEHYAIRFIDLPGFGLNHHIDIRECDFAQFCELVAAHIPENATLVGWSLGGLVAQYIAAQENQTLHKLVLVCTSPFFMEERFMEEQNREKRAGNAENIRQQTEEKAWYGIRPNVLESFQSQLSCDFRKTLNRFLAIQAMGSETAKSDLKQLRERVFQYEQPGTAALRKGLAYLQRIDLRASLPTNRCQTLRVFGSHDSLVPYKAVEKIRNHDPHARYHVVKGASHAPFISHSDAFLKILREFL